MITKNFQIILVLMIGLMLVGCCKKERILLDMSKDLALQGVESNLGPPENLGTKQALGRWTRGPISYIKFNRPLPSNLIVKIDFRHVNPRYVGKKYQIRFGSDVTYFEGGLKEARYVLYFKDVPKELRTLEIISPVNNPQESDSQDDSQKGIFIEYLRLEENIHDKGLICNILNP